MAVDLDVLQSNRLGKSNSVLMNEFQPKTEEIKEEKTQKLWAKNCKQKIMTGDFIVYFKNNN